MNVPQPALQSAIYRELYGFLTGRDSRGPRGIVATARDIPRPLARGVVHFMELLRRSSLGTLDDDIADQTALAAAAWFSRLGELEERQIRLVASPLADHLNEALPVLSDAQRRIRAILGVPASWPVLDRLSDTLMDTLEQLEHLADHVKGDPELLHTADQIARGVPTGETRMISLREVTDEVQTITTDRGYGTVTGFCRGITTMAGLSQGDAALLAAPETEDLFAKRYIEGSLLHVHHDRHAVETRRTPGHTLRTITRPRPFGPLYVVIDTSGSMRGAGEAVTRRAILALFRQAIRQHRDLRVYGFIRPRGVVALEQEERAAIITDPLRDPRDYDALPLHTAAPARVSAAFVEDLGAFLALPLYRGADVIPALQRTLNHLDPDQVEAVEVVMISDARTPRVPPYILRRISALQHSGAVQFHAVAVGDAPLDDPLNLFDHRWHHPGRN